MDYGRLKAEITGDPLGLGYAGMTDGQIVGSMNARTRSRNRATMSASEVLNAVVASEYTGLNTTNKGLLWDVLHLGTLYPFGVEATLLTSVFGAGSATIAALALLRKEAVSRAEELGLEPISVGYVEKARAFGEA
jgi:hypothetical protein